MTKVCFPTHVREAVVALPFFAHAGMRRLAAVMPQEQADIVGLGGLWYVVSGS